MAKLLFVNLECSQFTSVLYIETNFLDFLIFIRGISAEYLLFREIGLLSLPFDSHRYFCVAWEIGLSLFSETWLIRFRFPLLVFFVKIMLCHFPFECGCTASKNDSYRVFAVLVYDKENHGVQA